MTNPGPIELNERIEIVDVLRGSAICGILLGNIQWFAGFFILPEVLREQTPFADQIAQFLIHFFIDGKFYSIFSFLFGFGFALQIERAERRGDSRAELFRRRLFWMLVIGLLHAFLLWFGDILSIYALMGFLLVRFRRSDNRIVLRWALGLLLAPIGVYILIYAVYKLFFTPAAPDAQTAVGSYREIVDIISTANYPTMFLVNLAVGVPTRCASLFYEMRFTKILGMFLLGLYTYRAGILQNISAHMILIRRVFWYGLIFGLAGNSILAILELREVYQPPTPLGIVQSFGYSIGVHSLALCYIAGIALLYQTKSWRFMLSILAPVGRTALTNYLLQTIVCCFLFYGYGFGLFGKIGATTAVVLSFVIFGAQILFSHVWLKFFSYGLMEWIWRRLTYRRKMRLRRRSE
jgi:uncharacterized protein